MKIRDSQPKVGGLTTDQEVSHLLRTDRLALREFTIEDAPMLVELDSDPEVMKYISRGVPTKAEHIVDSFLPRILRTTKSELTTGFWAAILIDSNEFAGWFHLRPDRLVEDSMELGYRLRRNFWGLGLATEGSKALIRRAFERGHADTITAATLLQNEASKRVMANCGMYFDGIFYYPENMLPDWSKEERKAVRYKICRSDYFQNLESENGDMK